MTDQDELTRIAPREKIQTVNPATASRASPTMSTRIDEAREAAAKAHEAFRSWRRTSFADRGA